MRVLRRKVDVNQKAIVECLRKYGCSVLHLHTLGKDAPDLLVGMCGENVLVEVKTDKGKPTEGQTEWHASWRGSPVVILRTVEDCIEYVQAHSQKLRGSGLSTRARNALRNRYGFNADTPIGKLSEVSLSELRRCYSYGKLTELELIDFCKKNKIDLKKDI